MFDRFTILLVTLFSIASAFFLGFYFGKSTTSADISHLKENLQVSLKIHGNSVDVERSEPSIRVLLNGEIINASGSLSVAK